MKLRGNITISRLNGGNDDEAVRIRIEDEASGCVFAEVSMSIHAFGTAILGCGYQPCAYEFSEKAPIGKTREVKEELVPRPKSLWVKPEHREAVARQHFTEFEVDGWKGRADDLFNPHYSAGDKKQRVTFVRYV